MAGQLHELSALEQAAAIRAREIGPVELVEHYLGRIASLNELVGAFSYVAVEQARAAAVAAEKRLGEDGLPPLFGVPTAIKDLTGTNDMPTAFGSAAFRGFTPPVEAHLVRLLREAGTIGLGKLNSAEFGLSAYSDSYAGSARTPWDLTRTAGGSSGGSGAAVAAGLVPFAHGNDAGGSIRIPASVCGLFGFKPSRGRVSNGPLGHDPVIQLCQGPLARTVADAAAMLDAMAGPVPGDLFWAPGLPAGESFLGWARREPGKLRIGRFSDPGSDEVSVHPDVLAAYEEATELLVSLGHEVEEIQAPFGRSMVEEFRDVWAVRSLRVPVADEDVLLPLTRHWRARGRGVGSERFLEALQEIQLRGAQAMVATQAYDAVLSPTLALPPQRPEWFKELGPEADLHRQFLASPYAAAQNVTGQPSASVPLHWSAEGLPIGVMLTGRLGEDAQLLSLCAQLEAAKPWSGRWPDL
ncbi:amidase [Streptomyces sp. TRM66268-LWL]|uniref:Amidase n=1 Tax=Streptomyces polyasparticus TaxID=2767826 RepID=A0ABR7S8V8_9ACTN|nr:amidase [Streptomyces polyasparticus]MBC9711087.1 amidase [Streptomyces polyasparticus]